MRKGIIVLLGPILISLGACSGSKFDSELESVNVQRSLTNAPNAIATASYRFLPDYDELSGEMKITAYDLPDWAKVESTSGAIIGTPEIEDASPAEYLSVTASDGTRNIRFEGTIKVEHASAYLQNSDVDYYSMTYEGQQRVYRNDLSGGDLSGEVQFVQSHSVAPANNYERNTADETQSRYMPDVIALREALLLFIPDQNLSLTTMDVEVTVNGEPVVTLPMRHPGDLPGADVDTAARVAYSNSAWSAVLPWNSVKNGLSLRFIADRGAVSEARGDLTASSIDIDEASQIVFQSIRLGMLTHPDQTASHYTLRDPVSAATDYFQTLPVSKLIMGSYADTSLDRVIVGNGTIYDKALDGASSTNGDVYSGDMRESVGKSQVSVGINMANFGYTSNNMRQSYPHVFKQITNHHAWGVYQNGRVAHGLSGGNGIGTLYGSWGNEASHEWGHAYGLGHYPGQSLTDDGRWAVHHADSGWGYIAHRNRMRANIVTASDEQDITYHRDSMSGGSETSPFSVYTHYTGYSARIIQNDLSKFPIPDASYPSGYKRWNTTTGQYENHISNHPAPTHAGVPVATILGGYDPDGDSAVIYPVFHGNYGNLFNLPEPDLTSTGAQCWVEVSNANNDVKRVQVESSRHHASTINQLHFNLNASFHPTSASLLCMRDGITETLTSTTFSGDIPDLPPVATVGQEHGFKQLQEREMDTLQAALDGLPEDSSGPLDHELTTIAASYTKEELQSALSGEAWQKLTNIESLNTAVTGVSVLINQAKAQNWPSDTLKERLMAQLLSEGLINSLEDLKVKGDVVEGNDRYFDANLENDRYVALTRLGQNTENPTQWKMDLIGRMHPTDTPWLCLEPHQNRLVLSICSIAKSSQRWVYDPDTYLLKNDSSGQCLDYAHHNGQLITYPCTGNWNQQWHGILKSDNRLLAIIDGNTMENLYNVLGIE